MKNLLVFIGLTSSWLVQADVINLPSRIYGGVLFHNEKRMETICYVQINEVIPNPSKGKHCNNINAQMMFGLDDIGVHSREMEILLGSRRTNNDTEFHLPGTCGEVTGDVEKPWEIDRWGDDTTHLYNQVFAAQYKVNRRDNHYILIFSSETKAPTRAMIHRVSWLREDSYECRNLRSM